MKGKVLSTLLINMYNPSTNYMTKYQNFDRNFACFVSSACLNYFQQNFLVSLTHDKVNDFTFLVV